MFLVNVGKYAIHLGSLENIVGGWTTHLKNMRKSNWIISPIFGMNINKLFESIS